MAISGDSSIFRVTSTGNTETNVTDKIEFNGGIVPDNRNYIINTEFEMRRALGIQPRIKTSRSHKIIDTGFEGLTPIIAGVIKAPQNQTAEYMVKTWMIESQDNASFPFGRFGLRLNDNPAFNLTPNTSRGYYLDNFKFIRSGTHKGKLEFIGTLRYDGDVGSPDGNGFYKW